MAGDGARRPWSLVSDHPDADLQAIRDAIGDPVLVGSAGQVLDQLRARRAPVAVLDLVGHARTGACFLALGSWVLDDSAMTPSVFGGPIAPEIDRLGVRKLRLLGCSTGSTARGRAVLASIASALGDAVEVLATPRPIDAGDFASGYYDGDLCGGRRWPGRARAARADRRGGDGRYRAMAHLNPSS